MQDTLFATSDVVRPVAVAVKSPRRDRVVRVKTAFAELEEEHRIVLCLHYLEQLSLAQIAEVLEDSEENVRTVYVAAVKRLSARRGPRKKRAA